MRSYLPTHIKRNPETGASAWRTYFPEGPMAWYVSERVRPRFAPTSDVDSWDDLYTPPGE